MYEQNGKLKDDNVWKAYWVPTDKSFLPRCTADFSGRAYRFDFSEPRLHVFQSLGTLLRQDGVFVALFWLMKPPLSWFCPHHLPKGRPQSVLHRLLPAVIENFKIDLNWRSKLTCILFAICLPEEEKKSEGEGEKLEKVNPSWHFIEYYPFLFFKKFMHVYGPRNVFALTKSIQKALNSGKLGFRSAIHRC